MVTIKKIEIKGFFGKGDFEWNLNPVVNILGGKNGSGKSTIFSFSTRINLPPWKAP